MQPDLKATLLRFGDFQLDLQAEELLRGGRIVRLQPQPFKLLSLLASQAGKVVTRDEIRAALWAGDTFVDFDQGVNFAVRQVRDALGEDAERAVYIQTVPKRGYRFVAPVTVVGKDEPDFDSPTQELDKLMWANIAELKLAERRREARRQQFNRIAMVAAVAGAALLLVLVLLRS